MTSIRRRMVRANARKNGVTPDPRPQFFKDCEDGGYITLHATKGWRRVSPKRLKVFPREVA